MYHLDTYHDELALMKYASVGVCFFHMVYARSQRFSNHDAPICSLFLLLVVHVLFFILFNIMDFDILCTEQKL